MDLTLTCYRMFVALRCPFRLRAGQILGWGLLLLLLVCSPQPMRAQREVYYKAQSLFIYQFTRYVSWPPSAMKQGQVVIGVYGTTPMLDELRLMASLKKAPGGQEIVVLEIEDPTEIKGLHILYLSSAKSRELRTVLDQTAGSSTLIVAERGGLARKGASINFIVMENDTLRFEVNPDTLNRHRLAMAPELMSLGYVVR